MKTESFFNVERFLRDDVYASENIHHVALIVNNYIDNLESLEGSEKIMLCRVLGIYFDELVKSMRAKCLFILFMMKIQVKLSAESFVAVLT
jgi:hypothetical protein